MKILSTDGLTKLILLIKNTFATKESLSTVATSGSYNDLTNKPTIPTVNNKTITIQKNGTTVDSFTTNASSNKSINITVPTTAADVSAVPTTRTVNGKALSSDITLSASDVSALPSSTVIPTVDQTYNGTSTNAQSGVAVKSAIDSAVSSVYKPAGSIAFASLPTPGSTNLGNVYNMTDSFTTDSRFVEGSGKTYPAGTNVVIVEFSSQTLYAWDLTDMGYHPHYTIYTLTTDEPVDYPVLQQTDIYNSSGEQITWAYANSQYDYDYIVRNSSEDIQGGSSYKFDVLAGFVDLSGYQQTSTAVTHTASTAAGSATNPVYIASNGVATATTYTLGKSVPSDAVFTDTTYSVFTGAQSSAAGTSGLVPAPASGETSKYLKSDGTWATVNASPTFTYDSTTETLTIS